MWDKFYFYHKTNHLYLTVPFEIGKDSVKSCNVFARPTRLIKKDMIVKFHLFGVPIDTEDDVTKKLVFARTKDTNQDR